MGVKLAVRVTPRAGRDAIDGWMQDEMGRPVLRVRVAAQASEGAANNAVIALMASALKIPKARIAIAAGFTSRTKRLTLEGLGPDDLAALIGAPAKAG